MTKEQLLSLLSTQRPLDSFGLMVTEIVGTVADGMAATGEPLSAASVLRHLEGQCSELKLPANADTELAERIGRVCAHDPAYFNKLVACLMPTLYRAQASV